MSDEKYRSLEKRVNENDLLYVVDLLGRFVDPKVNKDSTYHS